MTDKEVKAPKIEFPVTDYPIKVISDTGAGRKDRILEIVRKHATINDNRVDERSSSTGKYTTFQLHIVATDQDQLYNINSELRATGFVHMVL
ncbi:DUF493 domain-containing protein [Pseudomonas sp.]|uniref:DUF493 domain-containing protein n=1 Tax=Pseudomonas sp. TaxID=306 RepID=UPI0026068E08|nr:DUF493 domain-containing protein [Pseudomonas sp.]